MVKVGGREPSGNARSSGGAGVVEFGERRGFVETKRRGGPPARARVRHVQPAARSISELVGVRNQAAKRAKFQSASFLTPTSPEFAMTTVEEDSAVWQRITAEQDELVIALLLFKQQTLAGIAPAPAPALSDGAAEEEIARLKQEVSRLRQVSLARPVPSNPR